YATGHLRSDHDPKVDMKTKIQAQANFRVTIFTFSTPLLKKPRENHKIFAGCSMRSRACMRRKCRGVLETSSPSSATSYPSVGSPRSKEACRRRCARSHRAPSTPPIQTRKKTG